MTQFLLVSSLILVAFSFDYLNAFHDAATVTDAIRQNKLPDEFVADLERGGATSPDAPVIPREP
jgi:hypothetical protein